MSRATRLRSLIHEDLGELSLRFSVRIWFYIYNNLYNLSIISRASKTALLPFSLHLPILRLTEGVKTARNLIKR